MSNFQPEKTIVNLSLLRGSASLKSEKSKVELTLLELMDPVASSNAFANKLSTANQCTVVTHPCGSCTYGNNTGALVEYYCDGGGNEPDFARCEAC